MAKKLQIGKRSIPPEDYSTLVTGLSSLLDQARRASARTVNGILTATYWEGRTTQFERKQRPTTDSTDSTDEIEMQMPLVSVPSVLSVVRLLQAMSCARAEVPR